MPKATLDGWNSDGVVTWMVVLSKLIREARLGSKRDLDFIACGCDTKGWDTVSHKRN